MGRRRSGEHGAETLEMIGGLPLLAMMLLVAWQGIVLMRQQAEVETDARLLARAAVVCAAEPPSAAQLSAFDPQAQGAQIATTYTSATHMHTVSVTLPAASVMPWVAISSLSGYTPHAMVAMHEEPC